MAIENINVGVTPNDNTGLTLRDAFIVVNGNFAQIDTKSETDAKIISATNPLLVRINDVEGDIEQINTELDTLSTISYVDAQIALVNSNINTVDNKVNLLDTDVDALTIRVGNIETILPNKLNDAPSDGYQYGRKDGQWVVITGGGTIDAYTKSESDALFSTKTETNTLDAQNVKISGNQSISGVKTFTVNPTVPAPTIDNQVANKKYVDDAVAGGGGDLSNYYTKAQTDTEIEDAISNLHTIVSAEIITEVTKSRRIIVSTGTATVESTWSKCLIICSVNTLITIPNNPGVIDFWVKAANGVTVTFTSGGSNISPNSTGTTISSKNMGFVYCANKNHTITEFATGGSTGDDNVKLTGSQTVAGVKTFSDSPIVPTPTSGNQASNKTYVDAEVSTKANTSAVNTLDAQNVKITGAQNISGVKTFSQSPIVPAPTSDTQAATKKYVDDAVASGGGSVDAYTKTESDALFSTKTETNTLDSQNVKITGNQSIAGVKTFSASPIVPTPTTATQATNKTYVDSALNDKANTTTVNSLDAQNVKITGDQTVAGVKTFSSSPKAPVASAYNDVVIKQQMDSALAAKANQSTTYTKTEVDTALAGKADKATTYTKTEVDGLLPQFWFGTQTAYDAIVTKDPNVMYFIEE